jgi:hypothetical protein
MSRRILILLIAAVALPAVAVGSAQAAKYRDTTGLGGGVGLGPGKIVLTIKNGKLKRLRGALPAHCERPNGDFNAVLRTHLVGSVKLVDKAFHVHVDDPNTGVEVNIRGKLKNGRVTGRVRMTYLDLNPTFPNNDILCDSGVRRYSANRV